MVAAEAGEKYGACSQDASSIDADDPRSTLVQAVEWVEITKTELLPPANEFPRGETVVVSGRELGAADSSVRFGIHSSYTPGIEYALASGGSVNATLLKSSDIEGGLIVGTVIARLPNGDVFFPGECQYALTQQVLEKVYGATLGDTMARAVGRVGAELESVLDQETTQPTVEAPVVLHVGATDKSLLEGLELVTLSISWSPDLASEALTICTKIERGWNDCAATDQRSPVLLDAFVSPDRALEVWLLDGNANLQAPLVRIGVINVGEIAPGSVIPVTVEGRWSADGGISDMRVYGG